MKRMGRPPKAAAEKFEQLATKAPEAVRTRVRVTAESLGLTVAEFIRQAIDEKLDACEVGGSPRLPARGVRGPRLVERAVEGQAPQANSHELFWESLERVQARRSETLAANKVVRGGGYTFEAQTLPRPRRHFRGPNMFTTRRFSESQAETHVPTTQNVVALGVTHQ